MALIATAVCVIGCSQAPQLQLLSAVARHDLPKAELLLKDPAVDVNYRTPRLGQTALISASGLGHVDMVHLLLRHGANPNLPAKDNSTALLFAAYHGSTDIVEALIRAGADVNTAETLYGYTPLAWAAQNGHAEVVKRLLRAGADRSATLKNGWTPMQLAQQYGGAKVVTLLTAYSPAE